MKKNNILIILAIIILGAILRTPITGIGSIIGVVKETFNINNTIAGFITTIPLIAFTIISPFASKISNKKGLEKTLLISTIIITIGLILRFYINTYILFISTFIIGVGIAIGNVLIPVLTKKYYPNNLGTMTGFYTVIMTITSSIAAAISYPIASSNIINKEFSLGLALNTWFIISIIAIIIYSVLTKQNNQSTNIEKQEENTKNIWSNTKLYSVTLTMGLQSALFYCSVSWFGEIMISKGFSYTEAGFLLSISQFAQFPATFIVPILADKIKNKIIIPTLITLNYIIALTIMIYTEKTMILMIIAIIFYALSGGGSFSYVMYLFSAKTKNSIEASKVSGIAQSGGYLLAAIFPPLLGYIKDIANWNTSLVILLIVSIMLYISMLHCSKKGNILK